MKIVVIFLLALLWTLPCYAYRDGDIEDRISDIEWTLATQADEQRRLDDLNRRAKALESMRDRIKADPYSGGLGLSTSTHSR